MASHNLMNNWKPGEILLRQRWPWHVLFWIGYGLFRFYVYYITVKHYPRVFLEYMLLSEIFFVVVTYFTIWLYHRLFNKKKYILYFLAGTVSWMLYLYGRTAFQLYYLGNEPGFKGSAFVDIYINNITFVLVCFLFITSCKYFKDGYIAQQFEVRRKQEQLMAEVDNLKSQVAPHFLFNTLNNLYGLAVDKSDKLPQLMLRLSDFLRHSLYEAQKPLIPIKDEIGVLKSYIQLESIRLESDLVLKFDNNIPEQADQQIAPLILIVFMENAFKHAKYVNTGPVNIYISASLEKNWFSLTIRNNYNGDRPASVQGIGLANVKRRLEVLYPGKQHKLDIKKENGFYTISLGILLVKQD